MVKRRKKRKLKKQFWLFLMLVIVSLVVFLFLSGKFKETGFEDHLKTLVESPSKKISVVEVDSKSRPIAVMINNHPSARPYHSGLQDAYLTYEIIVEGGFTRYMAIYKDKQTERIGSVRSSRHYFLDYALENDAIYVHWGYSPQALNDITKYKIQNIDGMRFESVYFYRDKSLNVSLEHTGFTSMKLIKQGIEKLGYRNEVQKKLLLNYSVESVDFSKINGVQDAQEVIIPYSGIVTTSYKYDKDKKMYFRSVNNKKHIDYVTKKQYSVKNIITYKVSNTSLKSDSKGRQDINNIGTGTGYYISEGFAVPIKWEKKNKTSQTVYMYMDGTEINVNDGNTWIQIQPSSKTLTIKGQEES